ncbi:MAG: GNAT family N-acetyltransferase [Chloroflexi bacterium]|nr:GNAT family N-acetyltransferase [Chloroflexota bacterium]
MQRIGIDHAQGLRQWFRPERPGPLTGMHVLQTSQGSLRVDRWPAPRACVVETGGNVGLGGDPEALSVHDVRAAVSGFVEPSRRFEGLLGEAFPNAVRWPRVILRHSGAVVQQEARRAATVRLLQAEDAAAIRRLERELAWISVTWGGPDGLARSGYAWGAFVDGSLASVACSFFVGEEYEDIGVVTSNEYRGTGLAPVCAARLATDVIGRRRSPSWSTSPDNVQSLRVAEKLGFVVDREDYLLIVGRPSPQVERH